MTRHCSSPVHGGQRQLLHALNFSWGTAASDEGKKQKQKLKHMLKHTLMQKRKLKRAKRPTDEMGVWSARKGAAGGGIVNNDKS